MASPRETGIKVTLRKGSDTEFGNQIVQEGAASPADVFLTENSPAMALVDAAGLFAPLDADTLAQVPENFRPANGHWIGIAARSTVFAYDKNKLTDDQLPKSLLDLADPAWKGRWAASPVRRRLPGHRQRAAAAEGRGGDRRLAQGDEGKRHALQGQQRRHEGRQCRRDRGCGHLPLLLVRRSGQDRREQRATWRCTISGNQDPGAFVSISGGGVLASSKHPEQAQAFVKWVTGKGGQEILQDWRFVRIRGRRRRRSPTPSSCRWPTCRRPRSTRPSSTARRSPI